MYIPDSITDRSDYQQCVRFHGHTCMGLTIGYLAAKLAIDLLQIQRSVDEELVAIVENDACCCDAIQVLTGCTFGKGNFFFQDHGKMAFIFGNRVTNESVRLVLKPEVLNPSTEEQELQEQIRSGSASADQIKEYEKLSETRIENLFSEGPEAFFTIRKMALTLPPKAVIGQSSPCEKCGEMVMKSKLQPTADKMICKACCN